MVTVRSRHRKRARVTLAPTSNPQWRRQLHLPRHRSTTANVCALYPAAVQAPLPPVGPLLGTDLTAGDAALCWDPFEAYAEGLVENPNVFLMGEPGVAKSSLIKCWAFWQHHLYGPSRFINFTDPKGEYRALAQRLGLSVVRLAPGGTARINPLEGVARLTGKDLARERAVQTTMLASLAATQLARRLSPLERKALRTIVAITTGRRHQLSPATLPDVVALLEDPTDELCAAVQRSDRHVVRDLEELRFGIDELCSGTLAGMFDGPSTVEVDWSGPGLVVDLSGVVDDDAALAVVMVAAIGWSRQQRHRLHGRQRINVNDESYYMYKQIETVEFAQSRRKLGRQLGEANIDICHRPSDLAAQADDGSKIAKIAQGLLSDSAMKILFRQASGELAAATALFGLTETEVACVARLSRGRALWKIGERSLLAKHFRPSPLIEITDTDTLMRRDGALSDNDRSTEPAD
jgi:hypothetical protein